MGALCRGIEGLHLCGSIRFPNKYFLGPLVTETTPRMYIPTLDRVSWILREKKHGWLRARSLYIHQIVASPTPL